MANRMCKLARVRSWLMIFLTAEFCRKRAKLSKLGKKKQKKQKLSEDNAACQKGLIG